MSATDKPKKAKQPALKRGGMVVGAFHHEPSGGPKFQLSDTGQVIEEEGFEFNIPEEIAKSKKIYTFTEKKNVEIIHEILKIGGLSAFDKVTHVKSGDIVICIKSAWDDKLRTISGTITQVLSAINESCGCKHIEDGAIVSEGEKLNNGGKSGNNNDFINSEKSRKFIPTKITKDELQSIISGKSKVSNGDTIQSALIYIRGEESTGSINKRAKPEREKERLIEFIDKNNLWHNGDLSANKHVDSGGEHIVYEDTNDEHFVLKTNNLSNYHSWSDYLINLLLNNIFFPDTSYELIGFKKNEREIILPVVRQYFVAQAIVANLKDVQKYLFHRGFMKGHPLVNAFRNWDLGVMLGDLHDRNVLMKDDVLFFIDTKFFLSHNADYIYNEGGKVDEAELNSKGGYDYSGEARKIANTAGLITLPKDISGTNCGNCIFQKEGFCDHYKILLPVTSRMCCSMWDDSSLRSHVTNIFDAYLFPDKSGKEFPLNEAGGYDYSGKALDIAREVDLITLPKDIEGTNCAMGNCQYRKDNLCIHPKINLPVTDRQSCGWWNNEQVQRPWGPPVETQFKTGGKVSSKYRIKDWQADVPNSPRWLKKKEAIMQLSVTMQKLRTKVNKDLNSDDEKEFLTALVIAIMNITGERVGNDDSKENGHFGVTGFSKKHVRVIGNKVILDYKGKSGVDHEKDFSDEKIATALKKAIKNSPSKSIFTTSEGFTIKVDRVNKYLDGFGISSKNLRGYFANKSIIKGLHRETKREKPVNEKHRKEIFNRVLKQSSQIVGHGASTLRKHYMLPEILIEYIQNGNIIDLKEFGVYKEGAVLPENPDIRYGDAGKVYENIFDMLREERIEFIKRVLINNPEYTEERGAFDLIANKANEFIELYFQYNKNNTITTKYGEKAFFEQQEKNFNERNKLVSQADYAIHFITHQSEDKKTRFYDESKAKGIEFIKSALLTPDERIIQQDFHKGIVYIKEIKIGKFCCTILRTELNKDGSLRMITFLPQHRRGQVQKKKASGFWTDAPLSSLSTEKSPSDTAVSGTNGDIDDSRTQDEDTNNNDTTKLENGGSIPIPPNTTIYGGIYSKTGEIYGIIKATYETAEYTSLHKGIVPVDFITKELSKSEAEKLISEYKKNNTMKNAGKVKQSSKLGHGGHAHLRAFEPKEIKSKSFLSRLSKEQERRIHTLMTTASNRDGKSLSQLGIDNLKGIVSTYIYRDLDQGAGIAGNSVNKLSDADWQEVYQTVKDIFYREEGGSIATGGGAKSDIKNLPKEGTAEWLELQVAKLTVELHPNVGEDSMSVEEAESTLMKYGIKPLEVLNKFNKNQKEYIKIKSQEFKKLMDKRKLKSSGGSMATGGKLPEKGTPEWHQLQIAKKTINMNPAMVGVMGGQTIEEAKKILDKYGIKYSSGGSMATGGVTMDKLHSFIAEINEAGGGEFSLSGAYGQQELWAKDKDGGSHRIEAGSKKDIYEALIRNRYNKKYNPNYADDKMSTGGMIYIHGGKEYTPSELISFADASAEYDRRDNAEIGEQGEHITTVRDAIRYLGTEEVGIKGLGKTKEYKVKAFNGGGRAHGEIYVYVINMDERGSFSADVRDDDDKIIYEVKAGNELGEGESSLIDDGYMKHKEDIAGLEKYLKQMEMIPQDAKLITEKDFESGKYKSGGPAGETKEGVYYTLPDATPVHAKDTKIIIAKQGSPVKHPHGEYQLYMVYWEAPDGRRYFEQRNLSNGKAVVRAEDFKDTILAGYEISELIKKRNKN